MRVLVTPDKFKNAPASAFVLRTAVCRVPRPRACKVGVLLLIKLLLLASPAVAQSLATVLNPDWDRTFARGIEWCAPVGGEPATALFVCTKDAQLDLFDLKTGETGFAEPISTQPGTRFAGESAGVAYCYGPSRVYAVLLPRRDRKRAATTESSDQPKRQQLGLLWQVAAAPQSQTEGDPEFLTRLVAAKATPGGVLIVRSDGRVAELRRKDGSARWQHKLPKIASCTLHVRNAGAALLWKHGGEFKVAFYDLRSDSARPTMTTVNEAMPIWTALADEGLVAVWRKRFALIHMDGAACFHEMHPKNSATAATVAVYVPSRASAAGPSASSTAGSLLLVGNKRLTAYDVSRGQRSWPDEDVVMLQVTVEPCLSLWVSGDLVFQTGAGWFAVCRADTGEGFYSRLRPSSPIGVGYQDGFAYGLLKGNEVYAAGNAVGSLRLVRKAIGGILQRSPKQPVEDEPREYLLGKAGLVRDTFWLRGTLIVVEENRIRAYTLP